MIAEGCGYCAHCGYGGETSPDCPHLIARLEREPIDPDVEIPAAVQRRAHALNIAARSCYALGERSRGDEFFARALALVAEWA